MFIDARVPIVFGAITEAQPDYAILIEGDAEAPAGRIVVRLTTDPTAQHATGCVCCVTRSAAGSALAGLFLARGRGDVAYFRRVLAISADPKSILAAVEADMLASGWFRAG